MTLEEKVTALQTQLDDPAKFIIVMQFLLKNNILEDYRVEEIYDLLNPP